MAQSQQKTSTFDLDLDFVTEQLQRLQKKNIGNKHLFKPEQGKTKIRIVPNKHRPGFPIQKLYFH